VEGTASLVVAGVEVRDGFDAGLFGGPAERVEQVPAHPRRLDPQLAAHRMSVACTHEMIFVPHEIRQHVVPAPPGKAELTPMIVVGGLAAHIDHRIDG